MIFIIDEKSISKKLMEFENGISTELLDFTRGALAIGQPVYWTSMDRLNQNKLSMRTEQRDKRPRQIPK
ncbi:hypothetical protein [Coxiella burnetii]|uniref:hypothetical protein n=1 Tax=Coxiella burnetii TaxID=777 RepID=UPI000593388E|nr:hypothetical protein [Coxiella burnetii]